MSGYVVPEHTFLFGDSTVVYFLRFTMDPEYEDEILSFNFETEVMYMPLPHEEYQSHLLLCALGNRLCCSYVAFNSLSIYQLVDNILGLLRVTVLPIMLPHVSHRRFLPIHFHNNILLVAFRLNFDIPLFGNRDQHCLIIDFAANSPIQHLSSIVLAVSTGSLLNHLWRVSKFCLIEVTIAFIL